VTTGCAGTRGCRTTFLPEGRECMGPEGQQLRLKLLEFPWWPESIRTVWWGMQSWEMHGAPALATAVRRAAGGAAGFASAA
jgi:hypothetical protein